jgi:hypothetical protein
MPTPSDTLISYAKKLYTAVFGTIGSPATLVVGDTDWSGLNAAVAVLADEQKLTDGEMIIGVSGTAALANPTTGPTLTPGTGGSLVPGAYDVVYTKVNTFGETLPSSPTTITLTSGQTRITPSAITGLPTGVNINWYITDPNLAVLKLHSTNNGASFNINSVSGTGPATPPTVNTTASADHGEKGFITGSNGITRTITPGGVDFALGVTGDYSVVGGVGTVTHVQGILYDTVDPTNGQSYVMNTTTGKMTAASTANTPATITTEGTSRLSVVPVDAAHPVVVGTNDPIVGKVRHGTSFPSSPATNDQFLRDDQNKLYRYSGSAWIDMTGSGGTTINSGTSFPGSPTTGDLFIRTDQNKLYRYNGSSWDATGDGVGLSSTLTSAHILVGNGSNVATDVAFSGDGTLANTGALTLANTAVTPGSYTNANITVNSKGLVTNASTGSGGSAATIAHGSAFPGAPTTNDQFIRDDLNTLSRYDGAAWQTIGGSGGSSGYVGVRLKHSANQTVTTSELVLTWDTELFDTDGFHSTSTNPTRITIPSGKGGKYLLTTSVGYTDATSGESYYQYVLLNGDHSSAGNIAINVQLGTVALQQCMSDVLILAAGDYIELTVYQTGASNRTVRHDYGPYFSLTYLGA